MARVLIVEDQDETRNWFKLALEQMGHRVEVARHGVEGLHQLRGQHDLVILDLAMPLANGDVVLSYIRDTPELSATRVLLVSALPEAEEVAQRCGADAWLRKPVALDDVMEAVNRLLE